MDPHSNADSFARNPDNSDDAKSKPLAWRNAWDIPEITAETDAAVRERDADKRKQMYLDLQKKLQDDSPFIIMFQSTEQVAQRNNVNGYVSGPDLRHHLLSPGDEVLAGSGKVRPRRHDIAGLIPSPG